MLLFLRKDTRGVLGFCHVNRKKYDFEFIGSDQINDIASLEETRLLASESSTCAA